MASVPAPAPVAVVDAPPGADEMPTEPALVVVVSAGGTLPVPGTLWASAGTVVAAKSKADQNAEG